MARRTAARRQSPRYESVRRLERIERGGATVFYEVSRQGKWVMVRSGHVGLPGQTRMREYPTPPAASVAMERLVEDRLKEGWLEPSAETPGTAPPEPQPGKPRVGEVSSVPAPPDTRTVQGRPAEEESPAQRATAPKPRPRPSRTSGAATPKKKATRKKKP